jgi:hypothetical protein
MGEDFNFYKGSKITLDTNCSSLNSKFFSSLDKIKGIFPSDVYCPTEQYDFVTRKECLLGKVFQVDSIIEDKSLRRCIFKLNEINTSEIIYFIYDYKWTSSNFGFPFLTNKEFRKEDFCSDIKTKKDDFTDEIKMETSFLKDGLARLHLSRNVSSNSDRYYLYLTAIGTTPNVGINGVILLLEDKTKINKPDVSIDVKVTEANYEYSAFISLTSDEINLLQSKGIDKYRLYIYDQDLSYGTSEKLKMYFQCISEKKKDE